MSEIKFYFDESVELTVSAQLTAHGFDVVSAHSIEKLGDSDQNHLQRAEAMGRALCTYDADFLVLAVSGTEHAGIIYAQQYKSPIGGWVREISALSARLSAEEIRGQVIYLSMR